MQLIEKGVHAHFANLQNTPGAGPTTNGTSQPPAIQSLPNRTVASTSTPGEPFAKVNTVVSGSPADQAGLKAGDVIRSFGSVNWLNHERLTKVAETVQQNEGVCILSILLFP
jgi:26S proteasome non-ATPase regulatory subunit 9